MVNLLKINPMFAMRAGPNTQAKGAGGNGQKEKYWYQKSELSRAESYHTVETWHQWVVCYRVQNKMCHGVASIVYYNVFTVCY